jgi:5-oxopent-3-ene-1,2,5-tricarboxylate decarboxylase/2-hydroxyhepta-2,4-diene-1,7-dioate isomerase
LKFARFIIDGKHMFGTCQNNAIVGSDGKTYDSKEITWLTPVTPSKIIGLVLNYADHADELGLKSQQEPILMMKPNNTLLPNLGKIIFPSGTKFMHYEGELAVVIGRQCRKVKSNIALDYVKGYTIANDVTVRDYITNTFRPPIHAKGFDTFLPLGPYLVTPDEVGDISRLNIRTFVNGELKQEGNTKNMINDVPRLVEFLSEFMTLEEDDLILTGTPKGISPIVPGDKIEISIDNLGTLLNFVVAE